MKKTRIVIITVSFIACLLTGCAETPKQASQPAPAGTTAQAKEKPSRKIVQVIIEGDSEAKAALFKLAQQNPTIIDPQTGNEYFIMPVKPKAGIDYKIVQIKPDPNIDYKTIVAGDKSKTELEKLRRQITLEIQKQIHLPHRN